MRYEILCHPGYSLAEISLDHGEGLVTEAGAMAWMENTITVETKAKGGIWKGLKRKLLAGESFFQNTYRATHGPGMIGVAPATVGDITAFKLNGELFLERGAFLASSENISIDSNFQGLKGFFAEGMFVLKAMGQGLLFFNAYGDIQEIHVNGDYVVDNGYVVAWEPTLQYQITRARTIRSFLFSDQLMCYFRGQGRLWVQSRSPPGLASFLHPFRPVESSR